MNPAGLRLHGKPAAAVIGKTIGETGLPESWRRSWKERIQTVFDTGNPLETEDYFPSGNGARFFQSRCVPEYGADGAVANVLVVSHDLTERKRTEAAIIHAKEQWERTFDSVPDLIAILDDQHHVVRANQAMAERFGVTPRQCVGVPCYKAVHGTDAPPDFCPHARTLADGREHATEFREERLGGDFLVSTTPLFDPEGRMTGSVHVARDITERKRAEEALQLSEEKFAKAFAGNPAAIALTRLEDGLFLDVNDTWVAMNGYSRKEALGHSAQENGHLAVGRRSGPISFKRCARKASCAAGSRISRRSPARFSSRSLSAQVLTVRGEKVILTTLVDITARKRAEEALTRAEPVARTARRRAHRRGAAAGRPAPRAGGGAVRRPSSASASGWRPILHDHIQQLLVAAQMQLSLVERARPEDRSVRRAGHRRASSRRPSPPRARSPSSSARPSCTSRA